MFGSAWLPIASRFCLPPSSLKLDVICMCITPNWLASNFYERSKKCFEVIKNNKNLSLKEAELWPKIYLLRQSRRNIWNKIEKSSKTGQDKKSLISTSACILTATVKVWFLEGRPTTNVYTLIWDYLNISSFPTILYLKPSGNSWSNSYTKFDILDIKFRFTCGKIDLSENTVKFQNIMTRIKVSLPEIKLCS